MILAEYNKTKGRFKMNFCFDNIDSYEKTNETSSRRGHHDMVKFSLPKTKSSFKIASGVVYSDGFFSTSRIKRRGPILKKDGALNNIFILLNRDEEDDEYKSFILDIIVALRLRRVKKNTNIKLASLFNEHQIKMIPEKWRMYIMTECLRNLASPSANLFNGLRPSKDPACNTPEDMADPEKIIWKMTRNQKCWG